MQSFSVAQQSLDGLIVLATLNLCVFSRDLFSFWGTLAPLHRFSPTSLSLMLPAAGLSHSQSVFYVSSPQVSSGRDTRTRGLSQSHSGPQRRCHCHRCFWWVPAGSVVALKHFCKLGFYSSNSLSLVLLFGLTQLRNHLMRWVTHEKFQLNVCGTNQL